MLLGQGLWLVLIAYACSFLGALQVPVLMATLTYALIGFVYNVKYCDTGDSTDDRNQSILEKCASFWETSAVNSTPQPMSPEPSSVEPVADERSQTDCLDETILNREKSEFKPKPLPATSDDNDNSRKSQSGIYFKALFLSCMVTILYKHLLVLCLAFIPIAIYLCNKLLDMFGFKDHALAYLEELNERIQVYKLT